MMNFDKSLQVLTETTTPKTVEILNDIKKAVYAGKSYTDEEAAVCQALVDDGFPYVHQAVCRGPLIASFVNEYEGHLGLRGWVKGYVLHLASKKSCPQTADRGAHDILYFVNPVKE